MHIIENVCKFKWPVGGLTESANERAVDRTLLLEPTSLSQPAYSSHTLGCVCSLCFLFLKRKRKCRSCLYNIHAFGMELHKSKSLVYSDVAYVLERSMKRAGNGSSFFHSLPPISLISLSWNSLYMSSQSRLGPFQ